jgi:hypothetical protein
MELMFALAFVAITYGLYSYHTTAYFIQIPTYNILSYPQMLYRKAVPPIQSLYSYGSYYDDGISMLVRARIGTCKARWGSDGLYRG